MIPDLQRVLAPDYLAGLARASTDALRRMRTECTDLENGLSYVRRLAQGRLDLLAAEATRRAEGGGGDLGDLVDRLPDLLADGIRAPGSGRVDQELDPPDHVVEPLTELLDALVGPSLMTRLADLGDDELAVAMAALRNFEDSVSTSRRSLHESIDAVNDHLARRIAGGEAPTPAS